MQLDLKVQRVFFFLDLGYVFYQEVSLDRSKHREYLKILQKILRG